MDPQNPQSIVQTHLITAEHSGFKTDNTLRYIQTLENTSQISVSKLHVEIKNSEIQQSDSFEDSVADFEFQNDLYGIALGRHDEMNNDCSMEKIGSPMKSSRQQKFKRSTNNSHKKFISVARRWMFKNYRCQLKGAFQTKYSALRSTRTYFFVILAFIKEVMSLQKQQEFKLHFAREVNAKIDIYQKQVQNTSNENLKHFRSDEITDLKFSIKAFTLYFQGDIQKSIQCVYKKDKSTIVKKQHYEEALRAVRKVQLQFQDETLINEMIQTYGSKKGKSKPIKNRTSSLEPGHQKVLFSNPSQFLFPQMFGLNSNFTFKCHKIKPHKLLKPQKKTQDCDFIEDTIFKGFDNEDFVLQNQHYCSVGDKKSNFLIVKPESQKRVAIISGSTTNKMGILGFKPYNNQ